LEGITNFSDAPLKIASWSGIFFTMLAVVAMLFVFIRALCFGDSVAGWPSTVCIILFIGGVQLFCLGIMGQYISKIFRETKKRPHYIVSENDRAVAQGHYILAEDNSETYLLFFQSKEDLSKIYAIKLAGFTKEEAQEIFKYAVIK
jgi:hypothetical protein